VAQLLLFASAREAAGCKHATIEATTVGEVLDLAVARFGDHFAQVLAHANVWLDGDPTDRDAPVTATSEVAVLPPVSGG
jgi:molybdopterin converting factor small subunit